MFQLWRTHVTLLRVAGIGLLIVYLILAGLSRGGVLGEGVATDFVSLHGFQTTPGKTYRSTNTATNFHEMAAKAALGSNRDYALFFDIAQAPLQATVLTIDFFAPGYDDPKQERSIVLRSPNARREVHLTINSGAAPASAFVRVFYTGNEGVELANIRLIALPRWLFPVQRATLLGGILLVLATLVFPVTMRYRLAPSGLGGLAARLYSVIPLFVIFLAGALIRFALYLLTPFWSGDEYRYKSIALGIWEFGKSGVLRPENVGLPVDLPALLYPYLVAPMFALDGDFYVGMRLLNSLLICATVFPVFYLARKFLSHRVALLVSSLRPFLFRSPISEHTQ